MKACILEGSPRKNGNTMQLTALFIEELQSAGAECREFFLYDMQLEPCVGCCRCQSIPENTDGLSASEMFNCSRQDEMAQIFSAVLEADIIVLSTPIYSWYCTPPMKSVMDRLVYGLNKYFGGGERRALAAGKKLALIMTCGYKPERGSDLLEEGIRRFSRHSQIEYIGSVTERNYGYDKVFMDKDREERIRSFARECVS